MEETQNNCHSSSIWCSMQYLTSWIFNDHENGEESAQNYREDLVNDLKAAGTIVIKKTIGNTLHREGLKSCCARKVPLLKKAHVQEECCLWVQNMKRQYRKAERMWRKTKLEIHYSIYKDSLHAFNLELNIGTSIWNWTTLHYSNVCNVCNVCRVGEERKSVSLHCTPGVDSSNSLAKATVGEPEKDTIVLSLGRVNIPIFAGYSLSILTILVSILINFPL